MKLDKYISELLFEHDCVVVPGFGGFITNYAPARIHPTQHAFDPPSKKIVFNKSLVNNDGLLAKKISESSGCSYHEALTGIHDEVYALQAALNEQKKVVLESVGTFYYDVERNLQFQEAGDVNYLTAAFGLTSFHSAAIKRDNIAQRIEKEFVDRGPVKPEIKKRSYKKIVPVALALPLIFLLVWIPLRTDLLHQVNYSSLNPFAKEETALFKMGKTISPLPELSFSKIESIEVPDTVQYTNVFITPDASQPLTVRLFEAKVDTTSVAVVPTPQVIQEPVQNNGRTYYVIAGCFKEEQNANNLLAKLKAEGFNASFAGQTKTGLYRVCYSGHPSMNEAAQAMEKIRATGESAWLLSL